MATTSNTYTGDGTTVLFPFTFEYIKSADIRVSLDGVETTEYSFANATTIEMAVAPANGVEIIVYRDTSVDALEAVFYPGSAIRAQDLNDNFRQTLFVVQENTSAAGEASDLAEEAKAAADLATATANEALSTANIADANALQALSQSSTALSTANSAAADAAIANTNAATALNAVGSAVQYDLVANVAAIPSNPSDAEAVEVIDSTGIEGFSPLSGLPAGFVGDDLMSVRIQYSSSGSQWVFLVAVPQDPDARYVRQVGGTMTGPLLLAGAPSAANEAATKQYVDDLPGGATPSDVAPSNPSDGELWYNSTDGRTYVYYNDGSSSQWVDAAPKGAAETGEYTHIRLAGSTSGYAQLEAPAVAGDTTFRLPSTSGAIDQYLKTDGAGNTSWSAISIPTNTQVVVLPRVNLTNQNGLTITGIPADAKRIGIQLWRVVPSNNDPIFVRPGDASGTPYTAANYTSWVQRFYTGADPFGGDGTTGFRVAEDSIPDSRITGYGIISRSDISDDKLYFSWNGQRTNTINAMNYNLTAHGQVDSAPWGSITIETSSGTFSSGYATIFYEV